MEWTEREIHDYVQLYKFRYRPNDILCKDVETALKIKDTDRFLLELNKCIKESIGYIDCYIKRFKHMRHRNTDKPYLLRVLLKYYITIIDFHNNIYYPDNNDTTDYDRMIEKYTENEPAEYIENELTRHLDHYIIIL